MASITLSDVLFYKNGVSGHSNVVGYESSVRRVARYTFTSPSIGASGVSISIPTIGKQDGSHLPIKFFIGTSPTSHANAGAESEATGTMTLGTDYTTFTAEASVILLPNTTYYLWIFPGADQYGWYGWASTTGIATLTTSGATMSEISGSSGTLGVAHTLTLKRYSTALSHTITAVCGTESLTIATGLQADSVKWTPPITWAKQNTSGTSVSVVITLTTYSGSTKVGTKTITLTFSIPDSVKPTVSLEVSDKQTYLATYGNYIQSKSQASVAVTAAGSYGSTIKASSVTCGALSGSGINVVFDLPAAGEIAVSVTVTDSRGRTATASTTISVTEYTAPAASIASQPYRCDAEGNEDDEGSYAAAVFSAVVTPLDGRNSASYRLLYRVRGTESWTGISLDDLTGEYAPASVLQIFPADPDCGYDVCLEVTDNFGSVKSAYRTVQVSFKLFDADRATKAWGFGRRATVPGAAVFALRVMMDAGWTADSMYSGESDADESDLNSWLDSQLGSMVEHSVKFVAIQCGAVSADMLHGFLCCHSDTEVSVFLWSVNKILYFKTKVSGAWGDTSAHTM